MNVRLDYRHIHYWQRTLGRADHVPSAYPGYRIHATEEGRKVRPTSPNPLPQGAPDGSAQPLCDTRRGKALRNLQES
jgi:hypothetical protein